MTIKTVSLAFVYLSLAAVASAADDAEVLEVAKADTTVKTDNIDKAKYKDEAPDAPDAKRCKRIARTGTRIKTRVCATNRQWDEYSEQASETTEKMQKRPQPGKEVG